MKSNFYLVILLMTALSVFQFSCKKESDELSNEDKWVNLHAPNCGTPEYINFVNANSGCILGRSNNGESGDIILKTNDGGKTWDSIFLSGPFLMGTFGSMLGGVYPDPADSNTMYAAGINGLMRSTDNGTHWEKTNIYSKIKTGNTYFFDAANGILADEGIYKTNDSGKTWQSVYKSDAFAFSFNMLHFTSKQTGYATGGTAFDATNFGMMVKTTDGGNTWQQIDYPFHDIISMSFINDEFGYISVDLSSSGTAGAPPYISGCELYKTTDGGVSWKLINKDFQDKYGGNATELNFKSEKEGFFSNSSGIYHSIDGGKTWEIEHHTGGWLCFPNSQVGYAVEMKTDGAILKRAF